MQIHCSSRNPRCTRIGCPSVSALKALWPLAFLMLLAVIPAHAQFRTSIQGTVTDPQGAVIPGATLTLVDLATNATIIHKSDATGVYNFDALPPDQFTLTVETGSKRRCLTICS